MNKISWELLDKELGQKARSENVFAIEIYCHDGKKLMCNPIVINKDPQLLEDKNAFRNVAENLFSIAIRQIAKAAEK